MDPTWKPERLPLKLNWWVLDCPRPKGIDEAEILFIRLMNGPSPNNEMESATKDCVWQSEALCYGQELDFD